MTTFKFLLVDDEKPFIETMAQRLHQRGYKVDWGEIGDTGAPCKIIS